MKIKCLNCNEIIKSKYRHDLVSCKCNNCYIDGTEILASDEEEYKNKYDE